MSDPSAAYPLLSHIVFPEDLRRLEEDQLQQVCTELRNYIIDLVSVKGGHFGASLGVVELTVALHYVLNTPYDQLVWDVGHQAYGHRSSPVDGRSSTPTASTKDSVGSPSGAKASTTRSGWGTVPLPSVPHWAWRWEVS